MPTNTVSVARPGPFGNPFIVGQRQSGTGTYAETPAEAVGLFKNWAEFALSTGMNDSCLADCVVRFRKNFHRLKGKNLACFCKVGDPCHGDVLLAICNDCEPERTGT